MTLIVLCNIDKSRKIKKVVVEEYRLPQAIVYQNFVYLRAGYTKVGLQDSVSNAVQCAYVPFYQQVHSQPLGKMLFKQVKNN